MSLDSPCICLCYWNRCSCTCLGPAGGTALPGASGAPLPVPYASAGRTHWSPLPASSCLLCHHQARPIRPPAHILLEMLPGAFSPSAHQWPNPANREFRPALPSLQQQERGREKGEETTHCKKASMEKESTFAYLKDKEAFCHWNFLSEHVLFCSSTQLPPTPRINTVLNGMLWPTFYVYYVSYADNEQRNLDILSLNRQYFSLLPSLGCYIAFLEQDVFSLIYVKYWTSCKHYHLKNYQGTLFDKSPSLF